jgi:UDP-N-acetyl-2-amino-2-deoxyglucuronate dehydrogenase
MLRVALVGAGGMARQYRQVYSRLPGVEFSLAVDPDDEVTEACRALGARHVSRRFEDALADGIDVVDISTPNHLHEAHAVAALKAGKHVLLQKPMANTLDAADRILKAAASAKGRLGMYMSSYTQPLIWEIKSLIEEGYVGKIQSLRARDAHRGGLKVPTDAANWRGNRNRTGGGSFIQLSIHAINLFQWWLGSAVCDVFAYSANQCCPNIGGDDVTTALARFENGSFAMFDSGWASEGCSREIYGTEGTIRMLDDAAEVQITLSRPYQSRWIHYDTPGEPASVRIPSFELDDAGNPFNQHRMFIEAIRGNRTLHMDGKAGRRDLAVVMAAYRSAAIGMPVDLVDMRDPNGLERISTADDFPNVSHFSPINDVIPSGRRV